MTILQAIILGIIQGLTEFLPISSSAHLVIAPYLFQWDIAQDYIFPFDVLVQLGTLVAVILYFWKDLFHIIRAFFIGIWRKQPFADQNSRMAWFILLATIPAGLAGIFLKDAVENAFLSPLITAFFLLGTAMILFLAERLGKKNRDAESITGLDALIVGIGQALSIFPGISRSGSTISFGMFRNIKRKPAGRLSFLMSIPIMAAAGLLSLLDLFDIPDLSSFIPLLIIGFITAAVIGYISIHWLLKFLQQNSLIYFSIYCIAIALLTIVVWIIRT